MESFDEEFRNNIKHFLDKGILQPLSGQIITVSTEDSSITYSYNKTNINGDDTKNVYSDQSGYFQTTILINNISQWHEWIVGTYAGETVSVAPDSSMLPIPVTYSPASDKIPRPSESGDLAGGFIGSTSVITAGLIGCAVLFLAVIAFIAFYYRKQIRALLKRRNKQAVRAEEIKDSQLIIPAITTGDPHVEITFPQIENPLPPVWGIREPLLIAGHALIDKPENGMNSTPQIHICKTKCQRPLAGSQSGQRSSIEIKATFFTRFVFLAAISNYYPYWFRATFPLLHLLLHSSYHYLTYSSLCGFPILVPTLL
jgi:hypothetical protein